LIFSNVNNNNNNNNNALREREKSAREREREIDPALFAPSSANERKRGEISAKQQKKESWAWRRSAG
jgi:hypothetical protein